MKDEAGQVGASSKAVKDLQKKWEVKDQDCRKLNEEIKPMKKRSSEIDALIKGQSDNLIQSLSSFIRNTKELISNKTCPYDFFDNISRMQESLRQYSSGMKQIVPEYEASLAEAVGNLGEISKERVDQLLIGADSSGRAPSPMIVDPHAMNLRK